MINRIDPTRIAQAVALSLLVRELGAQNARPVAKAEAPGDSRHGPDWNLSHKVALAIARILAGSPANIEMGSNHAGLVSERYDNSGRVYGQTPPNFDYRV